MCQTDALSHQRRTVFDTLGRPVSVVANYQNGVYEPATDGTDQDLIIATEYDAVGRRLATVAADGRRTTFSYDGFNRLSSVTENAGGVVAPANVTTSFAYC